MVAVVSGHRVWLAQTNCEVSPNVVGHSGKFSVPLLLGSDCSTRTACISVRLVVVFGKTWSKLDSGQCWANCATLTTGDYRPVAEDGPYPRSYYWPQCHRKANANNRIPINGATFSIWFVPFCYTDQTTQTNQLNSTDGVEKNLIFVQTKKIDWPSGLFSSLWRVQYQHFTVKDMTAAAARPEGAAP